MRYSMRSIWRARELILNGYSATQAAEIVKIPVATVRLYTKAERNKMKELKQV